MFKYSQMMDSSKESSKKTREHEPKLTRAVLTHPLAALVGAAGLINSALECLLSLSGASFDGIGVYALGKLTFKTRAALCGTFSVSGPAPGFYC